MMLHQTLRTVATRKAQMAGPIHRDDEAPQQARSIDGLHPDDAPDHLRPHRRQGPGPQVPQEVIQRVVRR